MRSPHRLATAGLLAILLGGTQRNGLLAQGTATVWLNEEDLRIGTVDGGPAAFVELGSLTVSPRTQRLFVGDGHSIKVFDPSGAYLRTIGAKGQGPGEFEGKVGTMQWRDRNLFVYDGGLRRATLFDEEGEVVGTLVQNDMLGGGARESQQLGYAVRDIRSLGTEADGAFAVTYSASPLSIARGVITEVPVHTYRNRRAFIVDAFDLRGTATVFESARGVVQLRRPLTWESQVAVDPSGRSLVVIHQPVPEDRTQAIFRVRKLLPNGEVAFARSYPYQPRELSRTDVDSIIADMTLNGALLREIGVSEEDLRKVIGLPEVVPPVAGVLVGADGSIWVKREETASVAVWAILDGRGDVIAQMRLPHGGRLLYADAHHIYMAERDNLDVLYLVRRRILK